MALRGITIVCIDDHEDTLEILRYVLESQGAIVHTATRAIEGLDLLKRVEPRVAIIDLAFPDGDGIALLQVLREWDVFKAGQLQCIMLSAYCSEQHRNLAFSAGVAGFLSKPFDEEKLIGSIQKVSGRLQVAA